MLSFVTCRPNRHLYDLDSSKMDWITLIEFAGEKVISAIFSIAIQRINKRLEGKDVKISFTKKDLEASIENHLSQTSRWAKEIQFLELRRPKSLDQVYIELDLDLTTRRSKHETEKDERIPSSRILTLPLQSHYIVLGQPGAGKTTLTKKLYTEILAWKAGKRRNELIIPIVVKLREINESAGSRSIFKFLARILGASYSKGEKVGAVEEYHALQQIVLELLDSLNAIIVFDGFDEISSESLRSNVIQEIRDLAIGLNKARFLLTSRSSDFSYAIANTRLYEIRELTKEQVVNFASKWLANPELTHGFLQQLDASPYADIAIRPLNLAHICAIFEKIGRIPEKPKSVYRRIVTLLISEWDEQRTIQRRSKFSDFENDRKFEFLANLAYELTVRFQKSIFSRWEVWEIYDLIYMNFRLPFDEGKEVVEELETHNGLFIKSGFEQFEFSHKSIQEYLAAEYIVRMPFIPTSRHLIQKLPNEIAIAVSISSNPSLYLCRVILEVFGDLQPMYGIDPIANFDALSKLEILQINKKARFSAELELNPQELSKKYSGPEFLIFFSVFFDRIMVEKPDFTTSIFLAIAILYGYSICLAASSKPRIPIGKIVGDRSMFTYDEIREILLDKGIDKFAKELHSTVFYEETGRTFQQYFISEQIGLSEAEVDRIIYLVHLGVLTQQEVLSNVKVLVAILNRSDQFGQRAQNLGSVGGALQKLMLLEEVRSSIKLLRSSYYPDTSLKSGFGDQIIRLNRIERFPQYPGFLPTALLIDRELWESI